MEIDRFWSKVKVGADDECWPWQGALSRLGYGFVYTYGKTRQAHRVAYSLRKGTPDEGLCVLHACDNPACCRPDHLWAGTHKQNSQDMVRKGRHAAQLGKSVRGEGVHTAKLTKQDVRDIRSVNVPQRVLAGLYGVSHVQIHRIRSGQQWKHI